MCHWTVGLIKINTLNLITPIYTVACNKCPSIETVSSFNTCINDRMEDRCSYRQGFYLDENLKESGSFVLVILSKKTSLQNLSEDRPKIHQYYLMWEVSLGDELQ